MPYFLLLGNPIQSHLDHPCTSYLASKPVDTNSLPKVALKSKIWTFVTILKGYPLYVHISLVGSWPLIIAHNKLSALDDLT
jgi:hypothetical protein